MSILLLQIGTIFNGIALIFLALTVRTRGQIQNRLIEECKFLRDKLHGVLGFDESVAIVSVKSTDQKEDEIALDFLNLYEKNVLKKKLREASDAEVLLAFKTLSLFLKDKNYYGL